MITARRMLGALASAMMLARPEPPAARQRRAEVWGHVGVPRALRLAAEKARRDKKSRNSRRRWRTSKHFLEANQYGWAPLPFKQKRIYR